MRGLVIAIVKVLLVVGLVALAVEVALLIVSIVVR